MRVFSLHLLLFGVTSGLVACEQSGDDGGDFNGSDSGPRQTPRPSVPRRDVSEPSSTTSSSDAQDSSTSGSSDASASSDAAQTSEGIESSGIAPHPSGTEPTHSTLGETLEPGGSSSSGSLAGSSEESLEDGTSATAFTLTGDRDEPSSTGSDGSLDPNPLLGIGEVQVVDTGFEFLEGPLWLEDAQALLFTDINADIIYRYTPSDGAIDVEREPIGAQANGLARDPFGDLIICEHRTRRVVRRNIDGTEDPVAELFEGLAFNSPNDAAVHPNGTIYFTDPPYGGNPRQLTFDGVYRWTPEGGVTLVEQDLLTPNGLVLSPQYDRLYVSFTQSADIWSYPVAPDGTTGRGTLFANVGSTADGMTIDAAGNLYATAGRGVVVLDPEGQLWGALSVPEQPSNCTFGGPDRRTLYVTARTSLYAVQMTIPGPALP